MFAFAANSILCRMALGQELIDAATFTSVRMISGALTLSLLLAPRWLRGGRPSGNWRAAAMLVAYMACFSFAYLSLGAGTGALIEVFGRRTGSTRCGAAGRRVEIAQTIERTRFRGGGHRAELYGRGRSIWRRADGSVEACRPTLRRGSVRPGWC